jgi:hypothetical protein
MRLGWLGLALLTLGGAGCYGYTTKTADTWAYDNQKVIAGHNKTQALIDSRAGFYNQAARARSIEAQAKAEAHTIGYF